MFGGYNDALAEMMFRYMADLKKDTEGIGHAKVNYLTFLKKFEVLIPTKPHKFSKYIDQSE
jgi:hypothetical protein